MKKNDQQKLVAAAQQVRANAYAPYSKYHVGAAVLTETGEIITGCNVENACFNLGTCAERTALCNAVSNGHKKFTAIVVATKDGGSPCGACRQFIWELCGDVEVLTVDEAGHIHEHTSKALLPHAFELNT